jgi:signal transduction histidine kinase
MRNEVTVSSRLRWRTILIAWIAFGLYMAVQIGLSRISRGMNPAWTTVFASELLYTLLWIPLTPLVVWLVGTFRFEPPHRGRNFAVHLVASLLLSFAHRVVFLAIFAAYRTLAEGRPYGFAASEMVAYVDYGVLLYWMIWLISVSVAYAGRLKEREVREAELETRLARAQLHALQSQLQPHFLFNTLNAISALVTRDPSGARRTITLLSGLMRETLALGTLQEVSLTREIAFARQYLEIEQQRFGDRLSVRVEVAPALERALVPSLILQPLLENAFKHGLSRKRGAVGIDIQAVRCDGMLTLTVENDGAGLSAAGPETSGVGIRNTRERLERLYGTRAGFELSEREEGRVRAGITIPFHEEPMHA